MARLIFLTAVLLLTPAAGICQAVAQECPRVVLACPTEMVTPGPPLTLSASVSGGDPNARLTFNWTASAGTIQSGQGTAAMTLDTTGLAGLLVTTTVEVGGLPEGCARSESCVASMTIPPPIGCAFDTYGDRDFNAERAHLDVFAASLQNEPESKGLIVVYAGRRARPGEAMDRARRAQRYLTNHRGIEESRLMLRDGGHRGEVMTQLWMVPPGASLPPLMPTLKPSEVQIIKGRARKGLGR